MIYGEALPGATDQRRRPRGIPRSSVIRLTCETDTQMHILSASQYNTEIVILEVRLKALNHVNSTNFVSWKIKKKRTSQNGKTTQRNQHRARIHGISGKPTRPDGALPGGRVVIKMPEQKQNWSCRIWMESLFIWLEAHTKHSVLLAERQPRVMRRRRSDAASTSGRDMILQKRLVQRGGGYVQTVS